MTVINPSSISGITSITMPSGDGNVLTIHTNDGTERFRIDSSGNVKVGSAATISPDGDVFFTGVTTATTFTGAHSGSGANLTSLPAAQLTGTLPAISGANLTGIAATDNVRTGILDVAGIATFRSDVNIPNISGGQIGGRRNIVINGARQVAQRGTSDSGITASEYADGPDRWKLEGSSFGTVTVSQSTDSPYGFGNSYKVLVTSTTGSIPATSSLLEISTSFEGQDVQGFAKGSSSAKEYTLSFYVRSNRSGTYVAMLQDHDNTRLVSKTYTVSDSNWNRYTLTYPADTTGTLDNDGNKSFSIKFVLVAGTDFTSGTLQTTWGSSSNSISRGGQVNFINSNDNYWQITGVQLEAGSQATAYEHRSYGEELSLCQRYFFRHMGDSGTYTNAIGFSNGSGSGSFVYNFPTTMRALPSLTTVGTFRAQGGPTDSASFTSGLAVNTGSNTNYCRLQLTGSSGMTAGDGYILQFYGGNAKLNWDAEL